jgi:flagellar basal body-associated protein FliL
MAENEEKPDAEDTQQEAAPRRARKLAFLGGGGVALVALAYVTALVALPAKSGPVELEGPFVAPLTEDKIQVNLSDSKSFLVVELNLIYEAESEGYYTARSADPVYAAELTDVLVATASSKTREEISDKVHKPVFLEDVRRAVEPLLFPVHVGDTERPSDRDEASGLAPGLSSHQGTFRPLYGEHVLEVDAAAGSVRIDDGPVTEWEGHETDLEVTTAAGETLYLDVSRVEEGFQGRVPIGVKGRARRVLWSEVLIQ